MGGMTARAKPGERVQAADAQSECRRATRVGWGAIRTVGRDHTGNCGDDGWKTELLDQVLESGFSAGLGPRVARLVMVKSNAVARAEKLVETVV